MPQNDRSERTIGYITLAIIFTVLIVGVLVFDGTHFLRKTTIAGVDCSKMTLTEAKNEVEKEVKNRFVKFFFMNGSVYTVSYDTIGANVSKEKLNLLFKEQHKHRMEQRFYSLGSAIEFDREKLGEFLKTLPELQPENMIAPQDAQVTWDGNKFGITDARIGNQIDFEEAVEFALRQLNASVNCVYFQLITNDEPDLVNEDAESMAKYLNSILHICLYFKLGNGEKVTLNESIIRTWVAEEPRFGYTLDVDSGIRKFVKDLAEKVAKVNQNISELNDKELNESNETEIIDEFIGNAEPQEVDVAYRKKEADTDTE